MLPSLLDNMKSGLDGSQMMPKLGCSLAAALRQYSYGGVNKVRLPIRVLR